MGFRAVICIVWLSLLAGCATFAPPPILTTEAEVLAKYGSPTQRWPNEDGTVTLEFSTQPNGYVTWMYTIDAGGIVLRREDALDDDNLARVERGMTRAQVARLLGQHRSVQTFSLSGEEVWDWNIYNDGPGVATRFNVHFIDGEVVRTSRTFVYPRDGMLPGFGYAPYPYYTYPYPFPARTPYRGRRFPGYPWFPW